MKRLLSLLVSACWLSQVLLVAPSTARGGDDFFLGGDSAGESFPLSGADVWGRVNPEFCGFPTVSFATDVVVLGRSTPADQVILFDGANNPLLDAADFGTPSRAGARLNLTFFDHGTGTSCSTC